MGKISMLKPIIKKSVDNDNAQTSCTNRHTEEDAYCLIIPSTNSD